MFVSCNWSELLLLCHHMRMTERALFRPVIGQVYDFRVVYKHFMFLLCYIFQNTGFRSVIIFKVSSSTLNLMVN